MNASAKNLGLHKEYSRDVFMKKQSGRLRIRQDIKKLGSRMGYSAAMLLLTPMAAAELERGQALYENHCRFCHESWVHDKVGSRINTLDELRQRVAAWSVHSGLGWDNDEIGDVTEYLNRHFYKITLKP